MIKELALADVRIDGGTQQRPLDEDTMRKYMALMKEEEGEDFPPVEVVSDGQDNWLWDGYHRYHCHRKLGRNYIKANVIEGTRRDAIFRSFGANATHGLSRQKGVAKKIILKILKDKEWGTASQVEIAMAVGVSRQYVQKINQEFDKLDSTIGCQPGSTNVDNSGKTDSTDEKSTTEAEPDPPENAVVYDLTGDGKDFAGMEVPEHIVEVFQRIPEIRVHVKMMTEVYRTIRDAIAANDPLYANCKLEQLQADIGNVKRNLRFTIPYSVCRYCCADVNNAECIACDGRGWVNESGWKATPEDLKKSR